MLKKDIKFLEKVVEKVWKQEKPNLMFCMWN